MIDVDGDVLSTEITDVERIVDLLTQDQKHCILNLSDVWKSQGYSKVAADLLYATDASLFPGRFSPLVDCDFHPHIGKESIYRHRLLPLGLKVKDHLRTIL